MARAGVWLTVIAGLVGLLLATPARAQSCGIPLLQPACKEPPRDGGPAPIHTGTQQLGFSDPSLGHPAIPRSAFMSRLGESGARLHRVGIRWQSYERRQGEFSESYLAAVDRDYRDELARGVRQVLVVIGTPYWALTAHGRGSRSPDGGWRCDGGLDPCNAPPNVRDPAIRAAWKAWVTTVVRRYPNAAAIEIWNEPNLAWNWYQSQDPELYALMLRSASDAARATGTAVPIVSGSVSTFLGTSDAARTSYDDFLNSIYRTAGSDSFDALGFHSYPCNQPGAYPAALQRAVDRLRAVKTSHGDDGKKLWLTETGATTGAAEPANCGTAFSETQQRDAIAQVLDWAARQDVEHADLPVALVHKLFDVDTQVPVLGQAAGGFGLIARWRDPLTGAARERVKPAYSAIICRMRKTC